ncbi:hypothetical protein PR048_017229 [Dryococelus australis]|uniref:PiggyBac transposable element-derived protein domain-containing protein n=1 Tax=Dryococelus australis TaxID=614101 RepID=A0ABQ9H8Y4_9NEOP|nr:hypothetical protein PR048_017229 [Dryococelus australis]
MRRATQKKTRCPLDRRAQTGPLTTNEGILGTKESATRSQMQEDLAYRNESRYHYFDSSFDPSIDTFMVPQHTGDHSRGSNPLAGRDVKEPWRSGLGGWEPAERESARHERQEAASWQLSGREGVEGVSGLCHPLQMPCPPHPSTTSHPQAICARGSRGQPPAEEYLPPGVCLPQPSIRWLYIPSAAEYGGNNSREGRRKLPKVPQVQLNVGLPKATTLDRKEKQLKGEQLRTSALVQLRESSGAVFLSSARSPSCHLFNPFGTIIMSSKEERYGLRKPADLEKVYKLMAEPLSDEDDECDDSEEDAVSDKIEEQENSTDTDQDSTSSDEENFLLRCIRFDNKENREHRKLLDKLTPIREVFEKFVDNCQKAYTMSKYATIDEQLESFRGRCSFRQYIPNNPAKYGIKIFALVDAHMFYTWDLEVYVGKQPDGPYACSNSPRGLYPSVACSNKKANVLLFSTMHHDAAIYNHAGNLNNPDIVTFHDSTKGCVVVVDKLCATYNTSRNSRRWPMTIFYSLLNIAGINANIIHIVNNDCEQMRRMFLGELVFGLVDEHLHSRAHISNLPKTLKERSGVVAKATGLKEGEMLQPATHSEGHIGTACLASRCSCVRESCATSFTSLRCNEFSWKGEPCTCSQFPMQARRIITTVIINALFEDYLHAHELQQCPRTTYEHVQLHKISAEAIWARFRTEFRVGNEKYIAIGRQVFLGLSIADSLPSHVVPFGVKSLVTKRIPNLSLRSA